VFYISQIDSLFKLFWNGNCLPFVFVLWVFPRTLLSLPHSFSLHPWQPAFLSPFMVRVSICQVTNHCISLLLLSLYISLILSLLFIFFSFFHGWKKMATIIWFSLKHIFSWHTAIWHRETWSTSEQASSRHGRTVDMQMQSYCSWYTVYLIKSYLHMYKALHYIYICGPT